MQKDTQKLKQKSQLNNFDMIFGACSITYSCKPIFPINSITNAEASAINSVMIIKCTVDIALLLLVKIQCGFLHTDA